VVLGAANGAIQSTVLGHGVSAVTAAQDVSTDIAPVRDTINNYSSSAQACNGKLNCVTALDRKAAGVRFRSR